MMWTTKRTLRAENRELRARLDGMRCQRDDARDDVDTERGARREAMRLAAEAGDRLRALTAQHAELQRRYDAAVGMDAPEVDAGRDWQKRRGDRAVPLSPPQGAGDRLPTQRDRRAS